MSVPGLGAQERKEDESALNHCPDSKARLLIIESLMFEETFKIIESNHHPCPLNHVMEYPVRSLFEYPQGW